MAIAQLNQDEEDEKQQPQGFAAPALGGGTTAVAAPASGAFTPPAAGGGSGFVNLQRYMQNASNDRAGQVRGAATSVMDKEAKRFDEATAPAKTALANTSSSAPDDNAIASAFNMATETQAAPQVGEGVIVDEKARADEAEEIKSRNKTGFDQLKGWLGASFDAPTVEYSPEQASAATMFNLIDPRTAAREVNKGATDYNLGNELLDSALFQADTGVRQEVDAAKKSIEDFDKRAGDEVASIHERGQTAVKAAADTRDRVREALGKQWDLTAAEVDELVRLANEQEAKARGEQEGRGAGTWKPGTGATRENTANASQRAKFGAIAELLGIDNLGQTQRTTGTVERPTVEAKPTERSWGDGIDPFTGKKYFQDTMHVEGGSRDHSPAPLSFDEEVAQLVKEGWNQRQAAEIVQDRERKDGRKRRRS
jgi:hypothetical protein